MKKSSLGLCGLLAATAGVMVSTPSAKAELLSYYVGVDNLQTLASGTYVGLPNPNYNHLTFLLAHTYTIAPASNHYHSKGIRVYTGANQGASTAVTRSSSDYVPEGTLLPIKLSAGSGLYSGKLVSAAYTDPSDPVYESSHLTLGNTQSLDGFAAGSPEQYLFNSSSGRWNAAFDAADIHWELVSLTPGLNVGDATSLNIVSNPGDDIHLGEGDEFFQFTPVLWTEANAPLGIYEATFRLVDASGAFGSSGDIRIRTEVVPEPASLLLLLLGGFSVVHGRRSRS